ncbi:MAG TPA: tetratricopeptide repeat protein [Candidatus Methanoperedens sp.]|nr:tetratricopeptide repeat protein [Candidatus Methanoperedens sp.]
MVSFRDRVVVSVLSLCVLLPPAWAGAKPVTVGVDALREEILASGGGDVLLFGPNDLLRDLFLPMRKAGKVGSLTLVVPAEGSLVEGNLAAWKSYSSTLSPGAGNDFTLRNGVMDGAVDGLRVRVVSIGDWKTFRGDGPVILDLSFFLAIYRDEVRTPFVELPRKFLATLDDRKVDVSRVRGWMVGRDVVPLEHGYLAKLVGEMLQSPALFRAGLPAKWDALHQGEYLALFAENEEALPHFEEYLKHEPEDGSVLAKLARNSFVDREVERGMQYLARAFKADPYYIRGYPEAADYFLREGEPETAERLLRTAILFAPDDRELKGDLDRLLEQRASGAIPSGRRPTKGMHPGHP